MTYSPSAIDSWKQAGRLFFWRFVENTRDFPGWHFMVDRAASTSIAALLRAMARSTSPCFRNVVVSLPTAEVLSIPNNRSSRCVAPERLRIEMTQSDPNAWALIEEGAVVNWQLGVDSLRNAADVFADPVKYINSAIGKDPVLWCWGMLSKSPSDKSPKRTRGG